MKRTAPLFFEHEGSRAVRDGRWKLVSLSGDSWELYDLDADPTEMRDLATAMPEKIRRLVALWEAWAKRARTLPWPWPDGTNDAQEVQRQ